MTRPFMHVVGRFHAPHAFAALALIVGVVARPGAPLAAQAPPAEAPRLDAARITTPPDVDGDVQGDPVRGAVPAVSEFWQVQPDEGRPASERTDLRVAFTDTTLYVGVVLHDATRRRLLSRIRVGTRRSTRRTASR